MESKYKFRLPIGDWSDDGHGKCDYFVVESNFPLEEVREAHYNILAATGISVGDLCSEYGEYTICEEEMTKLKNFGFRFDPDSDFEECGNPTSAEMADVWLFLLEKAKPGLKLNRIDDAPLFVFYGFDERGRHIYGPGYGLFE